MSEITDSVAQPYTVMNIKSFYIVILDTTLFVEIWSRTM